MDIIRNLQSTEQSVQQKLEDLNRKYKIQGFIHQDEGEDHLPQQIHLRRSSSVDDREQSPEANQPLIHPLQQQVHNQSIYLHPVNSQQEDNQPDLNPQISLCLQEIHQVQQENYYNSQIFPNHIYKYFNIPAKKILPPASTIPDALQIIGQFQGNFAQGNFNLLQQDSQQDLDDTISNHHPAPD